MSKVYLLDCTLRDGGYVNDWQFGEETIKGFSRKIAQTGIEIFEVGFIKGDHYDPNRSVFPDTKSMAHVIQPKAHHYSANISSDTESMFVSIFQFLKFLDCHN